MNVSLKVQEIIEQTKNGTLGHVLNFRPKYQSLTPRCGAYLEMLHELSKTVDTQQQLKDAFKILTRETIDYLLEFVVNYCERKSYHHHCLYEVLYLISNTKKSATSKTFGYFIYYFYAALYDNIELGRSDIHVLAFIFISLNWTCINTSVKNFPANELKLFRDWNVMIKNRIDFSKISSYKLKSIRNMDCECTNFLQRCIHNKQINIIMNKDTRVAYFLYNNVECFGLLGNKNCVNTLANWTDFCSKPDLDAIIFAFGVFEFKKLSVNQILVCMASPFVREHLTHFVKGIRHDSDSVIICHRIKYWIVKYPQLIIKMNNNTNKYYSSLSSLIFLCYLIRNKNISIVEPFGNLFIWLDKYNLESLLKDAPINIPDCIWSRNSAFIAFQTIYTSLKLLDDYSIISLIAISLPVKHSGTLKSIIVYSRNIAKHNEYLIRIRQRTCQPKFVLPFYKIEKN